MQNGKETMSLWEESLSLFGDPEEARLMMPIIESYRKEVKDWDKLSKQTKWLLLDEDWEHATWDLRKKEWENYYQNQQQNNKNRNET